MTSDNGNEGAGNAAERARAERRVTEWAREEGGGAVFAGGVVAGVDGGHDGLPGSPPRFTGSVRKRVARSAPPPEQILEGVHQGDRVMLARAITLVESRRREHRKSARFLVRESLGRCGETLRIGITGVPGAGKSTFIESFGLMLCEAGHRVAVLAVDPTSGRSGGSILGDKTRMEELARHPSAFIRPSPSGGALGGVAARTRESVTLCEAAGFDVVIVETVGVGQSEIAVRGMVDFFLLLQIAGAGDELQGIKKGIIEMADAIVVNKADGSNLAAAQRARVEYARVLHYLQPFTKGWSPPALACSSLEGAGLEEIRAMIMRFREELVREGEWEARRRRQELDWFSSLAREAVLSRFFDDPDRRAQLRELESEVESGRLPAMEAVEQLLAGVDDGVG